MAETALIDFQMGEVLDGISLVFGSFVGICAWTVVIMSIYFGVRRFLYR